MKLMLYFLLYFLCLRERVYSLDSFLNSTNSVEETFEETFEFVNNAQKKLQLTKNPNIILVIGNTGSGKSTLCHYVAGDYIKIVSIEPTGHAPDYSIHDGFDPDNVHHSTESRTIIPEMLVDEEQNVWYDCPGFGDSRNSTIEIATTFLIKSVVENASNMKIVLVVGHGGVSDDRKDFERLLSQTTQLLVNVELFQNSLSLVVTKVRSYYMIGRMVVDVLDESIKNTTAQFLNAHRSVLLAKGSQEKKIQLIDALLKQTPDGDYPRISIFWRPPDAGPFNTIDKMIDGRRNIRKSILEHSSYATIQGNDFGFPLTADTKAIIENMARKLIANIPQIITNIDNQLLVELKWKLDEMVNFHTKLDALGKRFTQTINGDYNEKSLGQLIEEFQFYVHAFNITSIAKRDFDIIKQQEKNFNILKKIADIELQLPVNDFVAVSFKSINYLSAEYDWYSFLWRANEFLSSYRLQKYVSAYNVADLSDYGHLNKTQGLMINVDNIGEISKQFSLTSSKLNELNQLIKVTLKSPIQVECDDDTITIKGNFVKSSDITSKLSTCADDIKKVVVYVVSTFYVDCDLNFKGFQELQIYAHKWHVLQMATFDLNGLDGRSQFPSIFEGIAGKPGKPGRNGGHFFGMADDIINGDQLEIKQNGGRGGNGQDGTSSDDVAVVFNKTEHYDTNVGIAARIAGNLDDYFHQYFKDNGFDAEQTVSAYKAVVYFIVAGADRYVQKYRLYPSRCCGTTGTGGPGGIGGNPGVSVFLKLSEKPSVKDSRNSLEEQGHINRVTKFKIKSGSVGKNGRNADACDTVALDVEVHTNAHFFLPLVPMYSIRTMFVVEKVRNQRCPDKYVRSTVEISMPTPTNWSLDVQKVVEYKRFLLERMKEKPLEEIIRGTYDAMDSNSLLEQYFYSVNEYVSETNALEKNFHELNAANVDVLPLYANLLQRIGNFSGMHEADMPDDDKKVLALLYTTILSKTTSITSGSESDLIIDIVEFLKLTVQNIQTLDEKGRILMIEQLGDEYNEDISARISEAKDFIEKDIGPDIDHLFEVLNVEMQRTINETLASQQIQTKEMRTKVEKANVIRRNAFIRKIIGVAEVIFKFVGVAEPDLKVITLVAKKAASTLKENLVDDEYRKIELPSSVRNVRNDLVAILNKNDQDKIDAIEKVLNKLMESSSNTTNEYRELRDNFTDFSFKIEFLKSKDPLVHSEIEDLLHKFIQFLDQQLLIFVSDNEGMNLPLLKAKNALAVVASSTTYFRQFSTNDEALDEIGKAINEDRESLTALMFIEDQIYSELIPMGNVLQKDLQNTEKHLDQKSLVALDVLQPSKVRNIFGKIQMKIEELIQGFNNEHNLKDCVTRINGAINLVTNIYSHIQRYQEHTKLAVYMNNLQSASYENLNIGQKLRDNTNQLRFNVQSNIIFGQYRRAMNSFKQAVFPFAAQYLDIYELPASLSTNNTDEIRSVATDRIKSLSQQIKEMNETTLNRNDESTLNAHFERQSDDANGLFYVWSNSDVKDTLIRLFAGEKVFLLADIEHSDQTRNAVKFNKVGLHFHSKNQTVTDQLKEILTSFHVSLTHIGESNYRCNDRIYTISSKPVTIEYSFAEHNGIPVVRSVSYDKLDAGVALLSPYTMWGVQLLRGQFEKLKQFADFVDIELYGRGQYVKGNATVCNGNLERFYTLKKF